MENMERRLRDMKDSVKKVNTYWIGLWKGEERKWNIIFEENTVESFPKLMKVQWISRINKTNSIPGYIIVKP